MGGIYVKVYLVLCIQMDTDSDARRKKPFRFTPSDDIALLKEVIAVNPYEGNIARTWVQVAENLLREDMRVDSRRCRERTQLLLDYFRKEDTDMLRRYAVLVTNLSSFYRGPQWPSGIYNIYLVN